MAAKWGPLDHLDQHADTALNRHVAGDHAFVRGWQLVSDVLAPAVLRTAMVVAGAVLLAYRRLRAAVLCLAAAVGSIVLSSGVKVLVGRPRPVVPHPVSHASGGSFPSGHALTSAVLALLVIALVWSGPGAWRRVVAVGAVLVALGVAFSRLVLGVHYISDVVGGELAAMALMAGLVAALPPHWTPRRLSIRR